MDKWLGKAREGMEKHHTVGAFTRQAKAHGETPKAYATQVLKPGSHASAKTKKRAGFLKAIGTIVGRRHG